MKRKKKRATLPRLTVMAYSREELLAFVEAVARLRGIADDLQVLQAQFALTLPQKRKPKTEEGGA